MRVTKKWLKAIRKSNKEKPRNLKHGMCKIKFYKTWVSMNRRCNDKNGNRWERYGGRGIRCEWKDFNSFKKDMFKAYERHVNKHGEKKTQIDRINFDKNYYKENCRWRTPQQQSNNKSNNVLITFKNKTKTIAEWSRETGISYSVLYRRYREDWTANKLLNTPINIKKRNKRYAKTR